MSITDPENLYALLPLIYALPSFVLSILLFYILLRNFRSPFYILFTITGITDCIWLICGYFKNRASAAPVFFGLYQSLPSTGPLLTFWFFLNYMLLIPARLGDFLLTLNRFTVIRLMSRKHRKFWLYIFSICVILGFVVAIALNIPIFIHGAYLRLPTNEHNFYLLESYSLDVEVRQSAYSIAVIGLFFPVNLAMNISIAYFLWKHRQKHELHGNIVGGVNQDAEIKLCFITFTMFVTNIVGLVCQMLFFIYGITNMDMSKPMVRTLSNIGTFAEDFHVFAQPWMLVAMSSAVRSKLTKLLWYHFHKTSPVVSRNQPSIQVARIKTPTYVEHS